jgi:hypothetical protein
MATPTEYGLDDHAAIEALRNEVDSLDLPALEAKQKELVTRLNELPTRRNDLDLRVDQARKKIEESRLLNVLNGSSANDLQQIEQLHDAAKAERQRFRIEAARLEFVAKAVDDRITYLHQNARYKAIASIQGVWSQELADGIQEARLLLGRLIGLYAHTKSIPLVQNITPSWFLTNVPNPTGEIVQGSLQLHKALLDEAHAAYESGGRAHDEQEEAKAAGRQAVAQKYQNFRKAKGIE